MFIDVHTHITYHRFPEFVQKLNRKEFTAEILLKRMDMEGIDKSVILPLSNPENADTFGVSNIFEALEAARRYPDRLIAFCNVDPRAMMNSSKANLSKMLTIYKEMGCKGVGEVCSNTYFDDELAKNLFHHCGECEMPIIFHMAARMGGVYGLVDDIYLPRLEKVLKEFPKTIFIGHAMAFWAEIDGDVNIETRGSYPKGKIKKVGRLQELLKKYPNLYGDLSAGSGYNAISRDAEYGYKFLEEFNEKLLFGTDRFTSADEPIPNIIPFIKNAFKENKISKEAYKNITHKNAQKLIGG